MDTIDPTAKFLLVQVQKSQDAFATLSPDTGRSDVSVSLSIEEGGEPITDDLHVDATELDADEHPGYYQAPLTDAALAALVPTYVRRLIWQNTWLGDYLYGSVPLRVVRAP